MSPLFRKYILRRNVQPRKRSDSYPTPRKALYGSGSRSRPRGSAESTSPFETDENAAGSRRTILVQTDWDVTMQDGHGVELQHVAVPGLDMKGQAPAWPDEMSDRPSQ